MPKPIRRVEDLVGEELNIVSFVMDYVEFHFNGPVIRALTNPIVELNGGRWQFPSEGSRDALCALIGREVEVAVHRSHDRIELRLRQHATLTISLDDGSYIGPEAAHFMPGDAPMVVYD